MAARMSQEHVSGQRPLSHTDAMQFCHLIWEFVESETTSGIDELEWFQYIVDVTDARENGSAKAAVYRLVKTALVRAHDVLNDLLQSHGSNCTP